MQKGIKFLVAQPSLKKITSAEAVTFLLLLWQSKILNVQMFRK
jgi:hypothetical protein